MKKMAEYCLPIVIEQLDGRAPAGERAPVDGMSPVDEGAPAGEKAPVDEGAPADVKAPVDELKCVLRYSAAHFAAASQALPRTPHGEWRW